MRDYLLFRKTSKRLCELSFADTAQTCQSAHSSKSLNLLDLQGVLHLDLQHKL